MTNNPKVLILYASYGDGHVRVSQALKQKFFDKGIKEVVAIDIFASSHPYIDLITRFAYMKTYTIAPFLYGWCYYRTKELKYDTFLGEWLHSFGMQKMVEIIHTVQPDIVINTFPMLAMPAFRKKTAVHIPTFTVLTDFVLHQRWIHSEIDKFYVATNDLKKQITLSGIPTKKIKVTGIPLRKSFENKVYPLTILQQYQLDPAKQILLVMAGAYGVVQKLKKTIDSLLSLTNFQVVVICGKNVALQKEINQKFAHHHNIRILGYVDNIHEFMTIASCILTKPGGVTLSEALTYHLPIILFRPVPGQERENAEYLVKKGAAIIIHHTTVIAEEIKKLLSDTRRLAQMKQAMHSIQQQYATENVVTDILDEMELWGNHKMKQIKHEIGAADSYDQCYT